MIRWFKKLWSTRQCFPDLCYGWQWGSGLSPYWHWLDCVRSWQVLFCLFLVNRLAFIKLQESISPVNWQAKELSKGVEHYTTEADEFQNYVKADALFDAIVAYDDWFALVLSFHSQQAVSNTVLANSPWIVLPLIHPKKEFSDSDAVMFGCNYWMRIAHLWLL